MEPLFNSKYAVTKNHIWEGTYTFNIAQKDTQLERFELFKEDITEANEYLSSSVISNCGAKRYAVCLLLIFKLFIIPLVS